ncbi:MAG: hypothetical protein ACXVDD_04945 [Polyangia bacterium]
MITAGPPVVYSPAALASSFWTEQNGDSVGGLQRPYLNGNDAGFRAGLQRARDNSVFWTKEVWNYAQLVGDGIFDLTNDFLANGGIIRSPDITPWPDAKGGDPLWSWNIEMGQSLHQMMTDRPFAFPVGENGTGFWGEPAGWLPTDPSQPAMLTKIASDYPFFKQNALREPGARLYLHTSQSPPQHGAATVRFDPAATASDWWETQPSTTRTPMDGLVPRAVRGTGCLFAITPDLGTGVTLCREIVNTVPPVVGYVESEDVRLRLSINRPGSGETHDWYVPHNATTLADPGDLIAWSVVRAPTVNKTDLYVYSASNIDASGKPAWHALGVYHLDGVLSLQGLYATNDALFVGTKHNGAIVRKADFTGGISHDAGGVDELVDMTWCTDASCIGDRLPSHLTTVTDWRGRVFAGVHRSYNQLFGGQGRHLYTTDGYEATAGGMNLETANYFYVSLTAQSGWAPLYHCVDWRVDYKMSWLSRDAACATGVDTPGLNGGIIGYVSTQPITGLLPLYQTRGPQGGGKYDQFSTVDDGEHGWVLGAGYQDVALLGWVWPRSQIFTTPPVVHGPPRPTN